MLISSYLRSFFILCLHSVTTCFCLKLECVFSLCLCLCEWQGACRLDNNADNCQRTVCVCLWLNGSPSKRCPRDCRAGHCCPMAHSPFQQQNLPSAFCHNGWRSKLILHSTTWVSHDTKTLSAPFWLALLWKLITERIMLSERARLI